MPNYFLDTSGLVKHYHPEVGTIEVDRIWADPTAKLFISRLSVVETVSVLAKKVRNGVLSAADFTLTRRRSTADTQAIRLTFSESMGPGVRNGNCVAGRMARPQQK
jgi:hypothetical protein